MKVAELREKLSQLKKEDIIKLSVEFYKLIPKAKKEDYDLDAFINNPNKKKTKTSAKSSMNLDELESEVKLFIEHAKQQYYIYPNRVVPKKERSTWRFKVKRWYKELSSTKRVDVDLVRQTKLLSDLYSLICEACGYEYFSGYDAFQSIGIEQIDFYRTVITLIQEEKGKGDSIEEGIKLIIDNHLNRYTLYSELMRELIATLDIPDLKENGLEVVKRLMLENGFNPKPIENKNVWRLSDSEFRKENRNNNLAELGYRFYCGLFEVNNAIHFYQENHFERNEEVKLYILVRLLFEEGRKEKIKEVLEDSIAKGITPRDGLMKLLKEIKEKDTLPNFL